MKRLIFYETESKISIAFYVMGVYKSPVHKKYGYHLKCQHRKPLSIIFIIKPVVHWEFTYKKREISPNSLPVVSVLLKMKPFQQVFYNQHTIKPRLIGRRSTGLPGYDMHVKI